MTSDIAAPDVPCCHARSPRRSPRIQPSMRHRTGRASLQRVRNAARPLRSADFLGNLSNIMFQRFHNWQSFLTRANIDLISDEGRKHVPKDDGLVADVQSRASGTLHNCSRPFNEQSVACYKARKYRIESSEPHPSRWRYSRGLLLLHYMNRLGTLSFRGQTRPRIWDAKVAVASPRERSKRYTPRPARPAWTINEHVCSYVQNCRCALRHRCLRELACIRRPVYSHAQGS